MHELLKKIEQLEKERSVLLNCILDIHTLYNDQRVKQALKEIGYIEAVDVPSGTITLTSGGGACPEQYWGTTDEGDSVYVRFRWGGASLHVGNTTVYEKDYDDPFLEYFQDGELEAFIKEAGYNLIKQF